MLRSAKACDTASVPIWVGTRVQIAITQLANRYPHLQLTPGQRLTFHPNISLRALQALLMQSHA